MRLTYRDKEIPLVCSANYRFWANVHEKLARYEDAEEQGTLFPRWIPVTERLPNERDGRLLVCLKLSTGELWQSICRYASNLHDVDEYDFPNENIQGFYYYDNEYGYVKIENVTHWMPLPTPPEGE